MDDTQAEWILTDVPDKSQLGTSKRIREKMTKMSQITSAVSKENREVRERLEAAEYLARGSRKSVREATRQLKQETTRTHDLEARLMLSAESVQKGIRELEEATTQIHQAEERIQELEEGLITAAKCALINARKTEDATTQIQQAEKRIQDLEATLMASEESAQNSVREAENATTRIQQAEERIQDLEARLIASEESAQNSVREVEDATTQIQQAEERILDLEGRLMREQDLRAREAVQRAGESDRPWLVRRAEIHMTSEKLGGGGWGEVKVAEFRGIRVAAKVLFRQLQSPYYHNIFIREMNMASQIRHPNLVQFIGASVDEEKVILMELMPTSLREHLETGAPAIPSAVFRISVSLDVAMALNYLHLMQPDLIIHRDISSANVLLEPLHSQKWRAKITDYGSVNLQKQLTTKNPGNPVYSAPESSDPSMQTTKMDIFSFGVLLVEMCTAQFPEVATREAMIRSIRERRWVEMIRRCTQEDQQQRLSASRIIVQLIAWQ